MKRDSIILIISVMISASLACSFATLMDKPVETQPESTGIGTPIGKPTIIEPFLPPTDFPAEGFQAGTPLDPTKLPALIRVGGGAEPTACYSENPEPSISLGYGIFPYQSLCLNNFPTAPDSPGFTVTLVNPAPQSFSETFTYSPGGILNSKGTRSGYIESGGGVDGIPGTPGLNLELYMPASLPCGEWTALATTQDPKLNIGPSILSVDCSAPRLSVLGDISSNPFISPDYSWEGPSFAPSETLIVVGSNYPVNTNIIVAFYQEDLSATKTENGTMRSIARYTVSILSDGSGNFQTPFLVGAETLKGAYDVVAAPVIDPQLRLQPFGARFSIE